MECKACHIPLDAEPFVMRSGVYLCQLCDAAISHGLVALPKPSPSLPLDATPLDASIQKAVGTLKKRKRKATSLYTGILLVLGCCALVYWHRHTRDSSIAMLASILSSSSVLCFYAHLRKGLRR